VWSAVYGTQGAQQENPNLLVTSTSEITLRVACVDEEPFSTVILFEFSAFRWNEYNLRDVQGLGDDIAKAYNNLVIQFCHRFFRNSVFLTYCYNFVAHFQVQGLCRGCDNLGNPIPFFGVSGVRKRELVHGGTNQRRAVFRETAKGIFRQAAAATRVSAAKRLVKIQVLQIW